MLVRFERTVLAARFSAMGDVAMTIPVLYSACAANPDTLFMMVTRRAFMPMFANAPANLMVIPADLKGRHKGLLGIMRLVREITAHNNPTIFVDLHNVLRTRLMRMLLRLRGVKCVAVSKERARKRAMVRPRNKQLEPPLPSTIERYADTFRRAGISLSADSFAGLYGPGGKADPALHAPLAPPKPRGEAWIGIAPFAAHPTKVYPEHLMLRVIEQLASKPDRRIFIFGGPGAEAEKAAQWEQRHPGVVTSLCGNTFGFAAELALLSHLDAMLTMDSGNMHLAALAGAPTVSIWGATHPCCGFAPWHSRPDMMLQAQLDCRPCSVYGEKGCSRHDMQCMALIKPESVAAKIEQLLPNTPPSQSVII